MDNAFILKHVDHTLLTATATWQEIGKLCDEALEFSTASVCVPPCYIKRIREAYPGLNVCTVIGFPLGYSVSSVKAAEAQAAIGDGADELDMVVNISDVKNGAFNKVESEIVTLKKLAGERILKVIVETCYLTTDEEIVMCHAVTNAGADYIKTSTGMGSRGATMEDIIVFRKHIGPGVKIKAAGGIRTREDMVAFLDAGCSRLGTSSAVKLLTGGAAQGY